MNRTDVCNLNLHVLKVSGSQGSFAPASPHALVPTSQASDGHRSVGIATAQTPALAFDEIPGPNALELWKMSKFGAVKSKVGCDGTGSEKAAGGPKQLIKRSIASPTATDSSNWSNSSIEDSSSPASPTHR